MNRFARLLCQCHNLAEEILFVSREELALGKVLIAGVRALHQMHGHHHKILLARVCQFKRFAQVSERIIVAHQTERIVRPHFDALV